MSEGLFRGHVHRRAGDDAALRDAGIVVGAGQTEVSELRFVPPAFEQDVARLDVAVDQVTRMGRGQTLGNLQADLQHDGHFERAGPIKFLLQRFAGDELHHQIGKRPFTNIVNLDHVLVPNRGRGTGFAQNLIRAGEVAAICGAITLTATTRCKMSSKARNTMPKPPLPSTWRTS